MFSLRVKNFSTRKGDNTLILTIDDESEKETSIQWIRF